MDIAEKSDGGQETESESNGESKKKTKHLKSGVAEVKAKKIFVDKKMKKFRLKMNLIVMFGKPAIVAFDLLVLFFIAYFGLKLHNMETEETIGVATRIFQIAVTKLPPNGIAGNITINAEKH